jgi:hypothetical protein
VKRFPETVDLRLGASEGAFEVDVPVVSEQGSYPDNLRKLTKAIHDLQNKILQN